MPAPKPIPGRRRPTDLLDQVVVAPAAGDGRVLVLDRPDELERRPRVVVEAAHERRDERVRHARRVEVGPDRGEVLDACGAERLADLRRLVERIADRRRLREVVVEHPERADVDLRSRVLVESLGVLGEPARAARRGTRACTRGSRSSSARGGSASLRVGRAARRRAGSAPRRSTGRPEPSASTEACQCSRYRPRPGAPYRYIERDREELHGLRVAVHPVLDVGAADRCGALGPQRQRAIGAVGEAVHLLLHDVRSRAGRPCEQRGVLEDRREDPSGSRRARRVARSRR